MKGKTGSVNSKSSVNIIDVKNKTMHFYLFYLQENRVLPGIVVKGQEEHF